ncbi:MAG: hypothetical protein KAQ69_05955 [Spirochaetales bacterium]|nr:hypothetical protein [Spirochaetales bacterium]
MRDISFEDAMRHFVSDALMNIIHRRQIPSLEQYHLEVGFRSMELPVDYFLWIIVPLKHANDILRGITPLS